MTGTRYQCLQDWFLAALGVSPNDRASWLHRECTDPQLRRDVERLLDQASRDDDPLEDGLKFWLSGVAASESVHRASSLLDQFELLEPLGAGSYGTVWKAQDTQLDRTVAIKVPNARTLSDHERQRLLREARSAAQLRHPHIVRVYDVQCRGDAVYLVSEFVDGETLGDWLAKQRPTPLVAAQVCLRLAEALDHAHEQGIVHRDLKPSNVMMDRSGRPLLLDFGLASRPDVDGTLTMEGTPIGTPAYVSPEQALGQLDRIDRRSDVYSLGVLLFELLTGERPFRGQTASLLEQSVSRDPPRPRELVPAIPLDIETICLKCLNKEPRLRYQSAGDLAVDLDHFLRGEPIKARPLGRLGRAWRWCRRNVTTALLAGSVLLALCALSTIGAIALVLYFQNLDQDRLRSITLVDALETAPPEAVPYALDNLERLQQFAVPALQHRVANTRRGLQRRMRDACALARIGEVHHQVLVDAIAEANPRECGNLVTALEVAPDKSMQVLNAAIRESDERGEWSRKARLSIVALYLGNATPSAEMLRMAERPDPVQPCVWIETLPNWHARLENLAEIIRDTPNPDLRRGACLAMGSLSEWTPFDQAVWHPVLLDWYLHASDAKTHSAASWALRHLAWDMPEVSPRNTPPMNQRWWQTRTGLCLVQLPAGEYSRLKWPVEERQRVSLNQAFWISDREISRALYERFVNDAEYPGERPQLWTPTRDVSPDGRHPAQGTNWFDAAMFCNWLSLQEGFEPCYEETGKLVPHHHTGKRFSEWRRRGGVRGFRLPTEAEWEYACRAGTETEYCCGSEERLADFAVFVARRTEICGMRMPNGWGLFDMHGNVSEWCQDWYEAYPDGPQVAPRGPRTGTSRILRGGSHSDAAAKCRSELREWQHPTFRGYAGNGIRVVLDVEPSH